MSEPSFSAADDGWILARTTDNQTVELSIRELLRQSTELREIVGDLPTQAFAILRLVLALVADALGGPADTQAWRRLWEAGHPPMDVLDAYLDRASERFELFHPIHPFLQAPTIRTARDEYSGLEKLIAEAPTKYPYFTTRLGRGLTHLSPAEATRWLVHVHSHDIGGIKTGVVGDPRVSGGKTYPTGIPAWTGNLGGIYVEGENLWQTLLLNTIPVDRPLLLARNPTRDTPVWGRDPDGPGEASDVDVRPYGPMDLFTWQSRRVRLRRDDSGSVTGVIVADGNRLSPALHDHEEPMSLWRRSEAQQKKLGLATVYMPLQHRADRALWRGLQTLLPQSAPNGHGDGGADYKTAAVVEWAQEMLDPRDLVTLRAIGMVYGSNNSVVDDVVDDRLTLRAALLAPDDSSLVETALDAVAATEAAVQALRNLAANLVRAAGGSDDRLVSGARDRASERGYAAVDAAFRDWLRDLAPGTDPDDARRDWNVRARRTMRSLGLDLVTAAGPAAWVGREHNGRRISSPEAENWFQAAITKALPVPRSDGPQDIEEA